MARNRRPFTGRNGGVLSTDSFVNVAFHLRLKAVQHIAAQNIDVAAPGDQDNNAPLPKTSDLLVMDKNVKADAWGNPFCIIPVKGKVAIVSGGPSHLAAMPSR